MVLKIAAAILAVALMLSYLLPLAFKLKEIALAVVFAIGLAMMLTDLWQSIRTGKD